MINYEDEVYDVYIWIEEYMIGENQENIEYDNNNSHERYNDVGVLHTLRDYICERQRNVDFDYLLSVIDYIKHKDLKIILKSKINYGLSKQKERNYKK